MSTAVHPYLNARTVEEGACLLWQRAVNSGGAPVASIDGVRSRPVRRWVYEAMNGPAPGLSIVPTCGNPLCVAPWHAEAVTPGMVNVLIADRGGFRTPAFRRARRQAARLASPITLADVREIRRRRWQGGETLKTIKADYPISLGCLSRICRGETWHDDADPWAGLKAAA